MVAILQEGFANAVLSPVADGSEAALDDKQDCDENGRVDDNVDYGHVSKEGPNARGCSRACIW